MRILCVEDDADACLVITILLEQEGHEVVTAKSAADGLKLVKQGGIALIILDNLYQRGEGIALCRQIHSLDSNIPILFYSAGVYESGLPQNANAGAQHYLIKPIGIRNLTQTVKTLSHGTGTKYSVY